MIRLAVSVEGRTEEEFVKTMLAGHLRGHGVETTPVLIGRARGGSGGGNVSVERLVPEMRDLYWSFDAVTSLVDFYGFRGREDRETADELEERLGEALHREVVQGWDSRRVLPYIQQYEFESLLFSDVDAFAIVSSGISNEAVRTLRHVRSQFPSPEDINDGRTTAPSKRIAGAMPKYRKVVHGPLIAGETGLGAIRRECRRFNAWMERMETLAGRLRDGSFEPQPS